jgi:hypothetical protein
MIYQDYLYPVRHRKGKAESRRHNAENGVVPAFFFKRDMAKVRDINTKVRSKM